MKGKTIAMLVLLMASVIISAVVGESVSMVQLIANPEEYHSRRVIITGFLVLEFEGNGIYLHKDDYMNSIYKNGLWCSIDSRYEKFNGKYVCIEGIFNAEMKGHLGQWSGSLEKISGVWEPAKGKE